MSFDTHKGHFPKSEVVVIVRMIKKIQATPAVTHFWATIYKFIIGGSDKFSDLPKVRYVEMNRIEVAFATVKDSQVFRSAVMPGLIDEGYLFVDEATNEFWHKAGSLSSNPSGSVSVSRGLDLSAMDQASTLVLVDVEENLFPLQIRSLVATALHAKRNRVAEDTICLRKLRWTLGNPRLPAWACSCEHVSSTYTGGKFVVRSAEDWTSRYAAWRRGGPAPRGPSPAQAAPSPRPHAKVLPGPLAGPPPSPPSSYPLPPLLILCLTLWPHPLPCLRHLFLLDLLGHPQCLGLRHCSRWGVAGSKCPAPHSQTVLRPQLCPLGSSVPRLKR